MAEPGKDHVNLHVSMWSVISFTYVYGVEITLVCQEKVKNKVLGKRPKLQPVL